MATAASEVGDCSEPRSSQRAFTTARCSAKIDGQTLSRGMGDESMSQDASKEPRLPPPWFIHGAWKVHRALYRVSGGRFLWTPASKRGWGAMHLVTQGRTSGEPRTVIVGYLEEGNDLIGLAMNGWDEGHPSWWLNLQADSECLVRLSGHGPRRFRAREALGDERIRLWQRWAEVDHDLEGYAQRRKVTTPVVVFEAVA